MTGFSCASCTGEFVASPDVEVDSFELPATGCFFGRVFDRGFFAGDCVALFEEEWLVDEDRCFRCVGEGVDVLEVVDTPHPARGRSGEGWVIGDACIPFLEGVADPGVLGEVED